MLGVCGDAQIQTSCYEERPGDGHEAIWCDPYRWIPEAARLLVPGGRLIFLGHSPWAMVCTDDDGEAVTNAMKRSYFELHRIDWTDAAIDPGGIEFNLPLSKWIRLFLEQGFRLDDYLEIQAL